MPDYDLIVLGAGPAGEKGAAQAAYFGKKVCVIERSPKPGGAAVNTGTIPSKTLRETALYFSGLRQRGLYGIDYSLREGLTVKDFMYREQVVVEQQRETIRQNLEHHKIEIAWGTGTIVDPHTVRVHMDTGETRDLSAEFILIATGSSPYHPPTIPFDGVRVYDSDTILQMPFIPQTMAVIGGGVIGSEYASVFTALGVQVTLIEARDRLLPAIDHEIAQRLQAQLESLGLRFVFSDQVTSVAVSTDHVHLQLQNSGRMECDIALFASGRQSNIQGLGLEALGVALGGRGLIRVNEHYQTSVPTIYAAGDVIGFPALASTAMEQARVAVVHAFDLHYKEHLSPVLPYAIYTIPEIAMAGLTEEECVTKGIPYLVGRAEYAQNPRGQIIGELSSELVHIGAHALFDGATIDEFIMSVYNYPTLSDAYKYAAYAGLGAWERWQA